MRHVHGSVSRSAAFWAVAGGITADAAVTADSISGLWNMSWLLHDARWAWRGVIGRGWRAPLIIGLLAAAIAANTAIFTVADALVFDPFPYDHPERVVTLNETLPDGAHLTKAQAATRLLEWRKQTDIFDGVGGYVRKTVFLTAGWAWPTRFRRPM